MKWNEMKWIVSWNKDSYSGFLSYVYSYVLKHGPIPNDGPTLPTIVPTPGIASVTVPPVRTPITGNSLSSFPECTQADTLNMPGRSINLGLYVQSWIQDLNG